MKKIFFLTILAFLSISCKESDKVINTSRPQDPLGALEQQLIEYNSSYFENTELRGFWDFVIGVIAGDAIGAAVGNGLGGPVGGIVLGAIASIEAGAELSSAPNGVVVSDLNVTPLVDVDSKFKHAPVIGKLHNKLIHDLAKSRDLNSISKKELYYILTTALESDPTTLASLNITHQDLENFKKNINTNLNAIADIPQLLQAALADGTLVEAEMNAIIARLTKRSLQEAKILTMFAMALVKVHTEESLKTYTNAFNEIVNQSEVSEAFKEEVAIFTAVAANSSILWEEK